MHLDKKEWSIIEHSEYSTTINQVPLWVREFVENELKPQMEIYPLTNAIRLRNKLEGFYEQKIGKYRLVFRVHLQTKIIEYCWIRAKPHATTHNYIS